MIQYIITLNHVSYRWMMKQPPVVQKVLGHFISTRWEEWETKRLIPLTIQDLFTELTNGADLAPGCEALDKLFHYDPVTYRED